MNKPDSIEKLIRLAGDPDLPSPEGTDRAREAARAAWQRGLQEPVPAPPRRGYMLALAAGVLLAVGATWVATRAPEPVHVARVVATSDVATLEGTLRGEARPGLELLSATTLRTASGRVALAFGDSLSLRMNHDTRLRFDAPDRVTLLAGIIYVDSGGVNAIPRLRIVTPAGEVRHVGTQFQVAVHGAATSVRVREGRVLLTRESRTHDVAAGDRLDAQGADVRVARDQPAFGAAWDWVAETAPPFDMESRPLAEFVAWIAREHGWQVRYGDAALQARSLEIRLHGSLDGLDAAGMLERVALVTGVPLAYEQGVLSVGAP